MQDKWWQKSINPIIGCKHGCSYCYAKRMNDRFHFIKKWDEPEYRDYWWKKIEKIKKPSIVFMGNMTDLFGDWVDSDIISAIIAYIQPFKQHNFLFLTKNPKRYADFDFPKNCWKGMTLTINTDWYSVDKTIDFVSIEPLMTNIRLKERAIILKWIIVGGLSPKPCHERQWIDEIVESCKGMEIPLYIKNNAYYPKIIKKFPKELQRI